MMKSVYVLLKAKRHVIPVTNDTTLYFWQFSSEELVALKNGLSHSICPPHLCNSDYHIYTCFELICRSMFKNIVDKGQSGKLKADLLHLANIHVSSHQPSQNDVKTLRILKRLRNNKNIVILKPDKGMVYSCWTERRRIAAFSTVSQGVFL